MAALSDLEHVVLGIVWKFGPMTAYAVRKEFLISPSSHFSGSTGAIYPLMERLEKQGLISSSSASRGKQARSLIKITGKGTTMLKKWLALPLPHETSVTTFNPVRTRFYFLKALSGDKRAAFLENASILVKEEILRVKSQIKRYQEKGDLFSHLAARNSLMVLSSQLKWLDEVKEKLAEL